MRTARFYAIPCRCGVIAYGVTNACPRCANGAPVYLVERQPRTRPEVIAIGVAVLVLAVAWVLS